MGVGYSQHDRHDVRGSGLPPRSSIASERQAPLRLFEMATKNPRIHYDLDKHCRFKISIHAFVSLCAKRDSGCASVVEFGHKVAIAHKRASTKDSPTMVFTSRDHGGVIYGHNWGLSCPDNDHRTRGEHPIPAPDTHLPREHILKIDLPLTLPGSFLVTSPDMYLGRPWRAYLDETVNFFSKAYDMQSMPQKTVELHLSFKPKSFLITQDYKRIAQAICLFDSVLYEQLYCFGDLTRAGCRESNLASFKPKLAKMMAQNTAKAVYDIQKLPAKDISSKHMTFTEANSIFIPDGRWWCGDVVRRDGSSESTCLKVIWRTPVGVDWSGFAATWMVGFIGAAITCKSPAQLLKFRPTMDDLNAFIECSQTGWTNLPSQYRLATEAGPAMNGHA